MTNTEKNIKMAYQKIFIVVLSCLCLFLSYLVFKRDDIPEPIDNSAKINELINKNKKLEHEIMYYMNMSVFFSAKIDSLENLKPKIKIKYVEIYKNIDTLSSDAVVNEFSNIFSEQTIE